MATCRAKGTACNSRSGRWRRATGFSRAFTAADVTATDARPSRAARRPPGPPATAMSAAAAMLRRDRSAAWASHRMAASSAGVGVPATAAYTARSRRWRSERHAAAAPHHDSLTVVGEPVLRGVEVANPEALGLPGHEEGERTQRRANPVLVAHHRHPLERRRMPGAEADVRGHGVAFDLARPGPEEVEQAHLAATGDLVAQDGLDRLLPVVVLDLSDRLEPDRVRRHVAQMPQHLRPLVVSPMVAVFPGRGQPGVRVGEVRMCLPPMWCHRPCGMPVARRPRAGSSRGVGRTPADRRADALAVALVPTDHASQGHAPRERPVRGPPMPLLAADYPFIDLFWS